MAVIRAVARGELLLSSKIASKLGCILASQHQHAQKLTQREYEVLCLMAEGLRDREIVKRLRITDRTVKNHVGSILTKLGVKSRTEAVSHALKEKLIQLD